jgi:hypothetical protein
MDNFFINYVVTNETLAACHKTGRFSYLKEVGYA